MADYQDAVNFIQEWEGGISGHPADNASKNPSPCGIDPKYNAPIHTNKGVQWATYKGNVAGYNCEEFLIMPSPVWLYLWEKKYFNKVGSNLIVNQAVANTYAEWAWLSGVGTANREMQSFLINQYGYTLAEVSSKYQRIAILNDLSAEDSETLFNNLIEWRRNFYGGLSDFSVFGTGWIRRLDDFKKYNKKYVSKGKNKAKFDWQLALIILLFLVSLVLFYFAVK
jgi:lysozyme family protein